MTFFLSYLSVIFLLYNVTVLIVSCFLYKYYSVFKDQRGKQFFLVLVFIGGHSLYLLFNFFIFDNKSHVYSIPFGLLYGPIVYNSIEYNNYLDQPKVKKYLVFLPFILVLIAMILFWITESKFLYNKFLYQVLYYITTGVSLFYFGIKLLVFFLKEIVKVNLKNVLQFKFHFEVGVLLIISAIIHFGFFIHFDHDDIIHSPIVIYFFMTIGVVLICMKMFEIQKNISNSKVDNTVEIIDGLEGKYAKSRLEEEVLNEYQGCIESVSDDFFYQPDLKLEMLEEELKIKKYYLTQTFSIKMETSFIKYTNKKRVDFAVKLLKENDKLSISDIAYKVGFSSVPNFKRAFILNYNKTPKEFKNECREKL